jgi:predicted esterase
MQGGIPAAQYRAPGNIDLEKPANAGHGGGRMNLNLFGRMITVLQGKLPKLFPALLAAALVAGCAITPAPLEESSRPITGYLDYSWDKNSVLFNNRERHRRTVFMDTFYPFDPSLRYNNAEAMVRHELDHAPFMHDGVLMMALSDLRKIYAPFMSYSVDAATQRFTVQHHFFRKRVAAGSGSRAPTIEYTKIAWQGAYALGSTAATSSSATHAMVTDRNQIDKTAVASTSAAAAATLAAAPVQRNGRIYVPVASFMRTLGKTITDDTAASGYLAVSHVGPQDTADDLFNPQYANRGLPNTPITPARVKTMNGLLDGSIDRGNLWFAYYFGDLDVFTGRNDAQGQPVNAAMAVDRVLPWRIYIPKKYDARTPSKFTFMLHGGTGNENAPFERPNDHLKNHPTVIPGIRLFEDYADHYNYIVLSPNGWTRNPVWGSGPGEQAMLHTLNIVRKRWNINAERMFIFGNSAGAAGAMNFVLRHGHLFKAMAPTAPGGSKPWAADLKGGILDMPTILSCFAADVTVFYAGHAKNSCQTWYQENIRGTMRNLTAVTVENGHHSFGPASLYQITFDHFERMLDKSPPKNVTAVRLTAGQATATVTEAGGVTSSVKLAAAPVREGGALMVALDDLARIYGDKDFRVYDVHAYNLKLADMVSVKTVLFNRVSVNIKPGERFLRVGGTIHAGDTVDGKTRVAADDPRVDRRMLSVAAQNSNGRILVPVVEFMQLFGKTVTVE